jgi:hypothetical protein
MLTYVLHTRCLREKFVHLIAHIELFSGLEVSTCELLLDPSKHLHRSCILCLTGFGRNALLDIEDTTVEDRWATVTGEIAGLNAMFKIHNGRNGLSALSAERRPFW